MAQAVYITEAELILATDGRLIARLGSDDDTPATLGASDTKIANAMNRASAQLEMTCVRGGRYALNDLAALQAADDWGMKGLVCRLALIALYQRRGPVPPEVKALKDEADETLKALASGENVFSQDADSITAGQVALEVIDTYTRRELNLVSDQPYFPVRRDRQF